MGVTQKNGVRAAQIFSVDAIQTRFLEKANAREAAHFKASELFCVRFLC
jgi:hypothetical protein